MPAQPRIVLMSCDTAIRPARIDRKQLQRTRLSPKIRSKAQHQYTIARAVAMGILTELRVAWPVPLVINCPTLAYEAE